MFTNRIRAGAPAIVAALLVGASSLAGCATNDNEWGDRGYEQGYDQGYQEPGETMPGEPLPGERGYQEGAGASTGETRNPYDTDY